MAVAGYILLDTSAEDHAASLAACTAAAAAEWPDNEPGIRMSNDSTLALVKVPAGFSIAGAGVLAVYAAPPRDLLAGDAWQPEEGGQP